MLFTEISWIDYLKKKVPKNRRVLYGIGDDCALVSLMQKKVLLKSDMFIEGVHFDLGKISYREIGSRAVARVLSDFAACAGEPEFIGVSAGLPNYLSERNLKKILEGVLESARRYNFFLIGGDTARSKRLFLDVWGLGKADKFVSRNTAKTGDYIFVTGKIGVRKFHKTFEPRIKEAKFLAKSFAINAMIDITDGFVCDLYKLIKSSGKGAVLDQENIPAADKKSLYRGEDYELIFTIDKKEKKLSELNKKFYCVGRIMPCKFGYNFTRRGKLSKINPKGYTHF
ncbi:MAG: thiamine-phosphate kinase [Candidatus Omnitrophica bacterium]|nr:thiamine-phosphate kinase [Candidatus Omnitrophota bacterium]MDD5429587.1 thiamine-phosphate kinase [Candidatus Omnitrophota bacterium]